MVYIHQSGIAEVNSKAQKIELLNISVHHYHEGTVQDIPPLILDVASRISFLCCAEVHQSVAGSGIRAGGGINSLVLTSRWWVLAPNATSVLTSSLARLRDKKVTSSERVANTFNTSTSKVQHAGVLIHLRDLATTIPNTDIAVSIYAH
jgi:hypothetical protein